MTSMGWFSMISLYFFRAAMAIGGIVMWPSFRILLKKLSFSLMASARVIVILKI